MITVFKLFEAEWVGKPRTLYDVDELEIGDRIFLEDLNELDVDTVTDYFQKLTDKFIVKLTWDEFSVDYGVLKFYKKIGLQWWFIKVKNGRKSAIFLEFPIKDELKFTIVEETKNEPNIFKKGRYDIEVEINSYYASLDE